MPNPQPIQYYTVAGAARKLGVAHGTIANQVASGLIPHVLTLDGKPLIRRKTVERRAKERAAKLAR